MSWSCQKCTRAFKTCRALMVHINTCKGFCKFNQKGENTFGKSECIPCSLYSSTTTQSSVKNQNDLEDMSTNENEFFENPSETEDQEEDFSQYDLDYDLLKQAEKHYSTGLQTSKTMDPEYISGVMLLSILKKAKCPLYLFDHIVDWARKSHTTYQLDFNSTQLSRKNCIDKIYKKFDLTGIQPKSTTIKLNGSNADVTIIWHDFKQCLYSLLMDDDLMQQSNLLDDDSIGREIDDVNSGSVWKDAQSFYIKDRFNEKLIPIIFFTDKTHTDIHGRLCLEPVQFTLGIFNRNTRNNPKAWRTIGYVTETISTGKITTEMKQEDYHSILSVILQSYKDCQKKPVKWIFKHQDFSKEFVLKIPCLFIIGDTEGHDKLCGRLMNRTTSPYLCRYCNIHRDNIDDPFYDSSCTKMSDVIKLVKKKDKTKLNSLSMHLVHNAWNDVQFCDTKYGLHGATLAELLHTLQQGIFEYTIKQLFNTKKEKKTNKKKPTKNLTNTDKHNKKNNSNSKKRKRNDDEEEYVAPDISKLGNHNVFSKKYEDTFEKLCKKYGKMLQHQSDRNIPRTFFNSRYMTITRKNGHEMAGLILVYLMIFSSSEGKEKIDNELGKDRCGAFIHVFELLLMMESFCKQEVHLKHQLITALNRKEGCGMKIIKFHLMKHFATDIIRYGSMKNFDSAIGERNHCTEVKDPAKHTQRRKNNFENQTAMRYVENLAITMAKSHLDTFSEESDSKPKSENKHANIVYDHETKMIYKRDWQNSSYSQINWKDQIFQQDLTNLCSNLIERGCLESPINFFTQHNRNEIIFRGDPQWKDTEGPWYDWAQVKWEGFEEAVPAQIQIFMDLSSNFKKSFQVGQSFVSEAGCYAVARTFQDVSTEKAHGQSKIVNYGEIVYDEFNEKPQLCMFNIESISTSMIAVPYDTERDIWNAKEWLILKPKSLWYDTLIKLLDMELEKKSTTIKF